MATKVNVENLSNDCVVSGGLDVPAGVFLNMSMAQIVTLDIVLKKITKNKKFKLFKIRKLRQIYTVSRKEARHQNSNSGQRTPFYFTVQNKHCGRRKVTDCSYSKIKFEPWKKNLQTKITPGCYSPFYYSLWVPLN